MEDYGDVAMEPPPLKQPGITSGFNLSFNSSCGEEGCNFSDLILPNQPPDTTTNIIDDIELETPSVGQSGITSRPEKKGSVPLRYVYAWSINYQFLGAANGPAKYQLKVPGSRFSDSGSNAEFPMFPKYKFSQ